MLTVLVCSFLFYISELFLESLVFCGRVVADNCKKYDNFKLVRALFRREIGDYRDGY